MFSKISSFLFILMFFISIPVHAKTRVYEAPLKKATWNFSSETGKHCSIYQDIPYYGQAKFTSKSAKDGSLNFSLSVEHNQPTNTGVATIKSNAPVWRQDLSPHVFGQTNLSPGATPISVKNTDAWRLLTELEQGMSPAFYYNGWAGAEDQVVVSLSPIHFVSVYKKFVDCVAGLPAAGTEALAGSGAAADSFIYFKPDSYNFTKEAKYRLRKISAYLKKNSKQNLVLVQGHTDSQGDYSYNDRLSKNRAMAVRDFLVHSGVDRAKIIVRSFGERKPVESNVTNEGRLKNRRVIIQVSK